MERLSNRTGLKSFFCPDGIPIPVNVQEEPFLSSLLKAVIITQACLAVLIMLANTTITLTILTTKSLQSKIYYKGIACMNTLDFLTGSISVPLFCRVGSGLLDNENKMHICSVNRAAFTAGLILTGLTINGITFLCIERYFSICHALKYRDFFSRKKATIASVMLIVPTVASTTMFTFGMYSECKVILTLEILFLVVLCPIMYYRILKTIKQSVAQTQSQSSQSRRSAQQRDMSKKLILIALVILVCFTPYGVVSNMMKNPPELRYYSLLYIALTFIEFSSVLNPMLFLLARHIPSKRNGDLS